VYLGRALNIMLVYIDENQIEKFITDLSKLNIEDKPMADALIVFAQELVNKCGDNLFDSKCAKAVYLQKVILLKTDPNNYDKNITIKDDIKNIDTSTLGPTVEKDADDDTGAGAPGSTAGTGAGATGPPGDDGAGAGATGPPVAINSTVPIANTSTGPSANNTTGPSPAPVATSDKNRVILSYDGSYKVQSDFKSDYHVLERKDETQCFAYNPSYNPFETVPSAEQSLKERVGNVGKKFWWGRDDKKKDTVDNTEVINPIFSAAATKGGKRKTKKRRTTRKLNQRKRLGFKSRSKK
jgi:hypothetical protein